MLSGVRDRWGKSGRELCFPTHFAVKLRNGWGTRREAKADNWKIPIAAASLEGGAAACS